MYKFARAAVLCAIVAALSVGISALQAQQNAKNSVPAAPIPAQILTAKKVFISNEGGDSNITLDDAVYGAGPEDSYNQFYAAMKDWGRYELVSAPADADLVFTIRFTMPTGRQWADPQVRVVILDPKTHVALWGWNMLRAPCYRAIAPAISRQH